MLRFLLKVFAIVAILGLAGGGAYFYAVHHWHAAQQAVKENRLDDARASLRVCSFVWPRSVPVQILAARVDRLDGEFDSAEQHLNEAKRLAKGSTPEIQVEYLLMRVQRGEEDEVAGELIGYVQSDYPERALILEMLSRAYMRNMRHGPAFTCLTAWMKAEPDSFEPYQWRGWVLERLNDWGGAMKDYEKALELNPENVQIRLRLAELQLEHSDVEAAKPNLEHLAKSFPNRADIKARLGQLRFLESDEVQARALLEEAVREMPNDAAVLIHLAKLELQANNSAKAEKWLRHALEVDPTDTEAEFTLVAVLQKEGRESEADAVRENHRKHTALLQKVSRIIQKEAEHPRGDPDELYEVGALFLNSANERVGLYWLHRALQRNPEHQPTRKALAEYYEKKGDKEKAAEHRRQIKSSK